jgi:hypothetical protein
MLACAENGALDRSLRAVELRVLPLRDGLSLL